VRPQAGFALETFQIKSAPPPLYESVSMEHPWQQVSLCLGITPHAGLAILKQRWPLEASLRRTRAPRNAGASTLGPD